MLHDRAPWLGLAIGVYILAELMTLLLLLMSVPL
jgi:hypothetical protein